MLVSRQPLCFPRFTVMELHYWNCPKKLSRLNTGFAPLITLGSLPSHLVRNKYSRYSGVESTAVLQSCLGIRLALGLGNDRLRIDLGLSQFLLAGLDLLLRHLLGFDGCLSIRREIEVHDVEILDNNIIGGKPCG